MLSYELAADEETELTGPVTDCRSASSLSDLKLSAARDKVRQVILAAFGAWADEQLPHD